MNNSNICSINQANFNKLLNLTSHHGKAIFLDKIIFWWQISKFSLNDNQKWFSRTIEFFSQELKVSPRTVGRYLKEFSDKGWIEKVCKLRTKKMLYLRVTDNLLNLIKNNCSAPNEANKVASVFSTEDDLFERDKMTFSLNKDKDTNPIVNNNVSLSLPVDKNTKNTQKTNIISIYPTYPIEDIMGNIITISNKNYIKGMLANLKKQYNLEFSSPEQLFAEIVFTLTNEEQLKGVDDFKHRVQIIAKLLRQKRWLTPKGFYNHSHFGVYFKKQPEFSGAGKGETRSYSQSNNSNNQKHEIRQKIDSLKVELNKNVAEMHSEISYYKTMKLFSRDSNAVAINSIVRKIQGIQQNNETLQQEINYLELSLEKIHGIHHNMIHNNFDYFEALRESYHQLKSKTMWAKEQLDKVYKETTEDSFLIDTYVTEYERLNNLTLVTEQKMSIIADKLFGERAA